MFRSVVALIALLAATAASVAGQSFPYAALQPYSEFREKMMAAGWEPDENAGEKMPKFKHEFAEIACAGGGLCFSEWVAKDGTTYSVVLFQDGDELRVGAQVDQKPSKP